MVETGQRVQESADKTADGAGLRVRVSSRWDQQQQHHQHKPTHRLVAVGTDLVGMRVD